MTPYYLVRDWTNVVGTSTGTVGETENTIVCGDKIFDIINDAKEKNTKISIFKIDECLIDWS